MVHDDLREQIEAYILHAETGQPKWRGELRDRIFTALTTAQAQAAAQEQRIAGLKADAAEWKQQHENLLAIRQQELEILHKRTTLLRRALAYLASTLTIYQDIRADLSEPTT